MHTVINNHVIPTDDDEEHVPHDWCECNPTSTISHAGVIWTHNRFDMQDLIAQAETIRLITSLELWEQEEKRDPRRLIQIVPLPENAQFLQLPPTAHK